MEYIAFDAHTRDTLASVARPDGGLVREQRIPDERGALQPCLERCEHGSPVAVETIGHGYWIVDEIEAVGNGEGYREPKGVAPFRPRGISAEAHELPEARPLIATSPEKTIMPRGRRRWLRRNGTMRGEGTMSDGWACSRAEAVGEPAAPEGGPGLHTEW